jgi:membrane-associated phospholipid phosphatase
VLGLLPLALTVERLLREAHPSSLDPERLVLGLVGLLRDPVPLALTAAPLTLDPAPPVFDPERRPFDLVVKPVAARRVGRAMTAKRLAIVAAALGLLTLLGVLALDRPLVEWVDSHQPWGFWSAGVDLLELAFAFPISKWATGFLLLLAALVLVPFARTRPAARVLAFVGTAQLATRLFAGVLKEVVHRARPFEVLAGVNWHSQWFHDHGSSFPSGHAAHFWGLYFPLVALYPRLALPLAPLPLFVSVARIAVNDHYFSDVVASAAIAALLTLLAYPLVRRLKGQPG